MSATATASVKTPSHSHTHSHSSKSHSHSHSHSRSSRPSTTPRIPPSVSSTGQSMPPQLSPSNVRTPAKLLDAKNPSPSYFGFVVGADDTIQPDSNPGKHVRQNWTFANSSAQKDVSSPRHVPVESNPDFEAFRRQSDHNHKFALNTAFRPSQSRTNSDASSIVSPLAKRPALERNNKSNGGNRMEDVSFFDIPRQQSPGPISHHTVTDHQQARLSLPHSGIRAQALAASTSAKRAETLPHPADKEASPIVSPTRVAELIQSQPEDVLVLDLRVYQQYATARIHGALNLCIPTTLLKRPAYNVQRLAETFTSARDQETFNRWKTCSYIVAYDSNSSLPKEAVTPTNVLKKFISEGWKGTGLVIKGGFMLFSKLVPEMIDDGPAQQGNSASTQPLSLSAPGKDILPVAGGCAMPVEQSAANPFFGNIRQNMDLIGGVGQMPIKKPNELTSETEKHMPAWLRRAASKSNEGKLVSDQFLDIEKSEQKRMQDALSVKVSYGTPRSERPDKRIQVAGIEKGSKNRYNNIFPYDHSRVKLQNVPNGNCDYFNANYVKAEFSNRRYIATQAPIPATFNDFWRVVWEQDVRVIVMLTAEAEGGQVKSHVYWNPGEYGQFKVKQLSERQVNLENKKPAPKPNPAVRPAMAPRRSTTANIQGDRSQQEVKSPVSKTTPSATVRHFSLSHSGHPFEPMREITQVHYSDWPDFGAPASPTELLGLVEQVNKYIRGSATPGNTVGPEEAATKHERPLIVHCSAGCGRTGTFCTIDSVIDMLKRQKVSHEDEEDRMDVDDGSWVNRDDVDLVAQTVDEFRHQRLSMVQNLRQFVLCYESILQWVVAQDAEGSRNSQKRPGLPDPRRSYHG